MSNDSDVKLRLNNSELWGGLIGLALGGFVIWSGLKLKLGTINDPGSGFVLFYTGILMCLFAASIIIGALTEGGPTFGSRWVDTRWTKPLLVIVCQQGYQSSLAAANLQEMGFTRATDLAGGFDAWVAAGLPVDGMPSGAQTIA